MLLHAKIHHIGQRELPWENTKNNDDESNLTEKTTPAKKRAIETRKLSIAEAPLAPASHQNNNHYLASCGQRKRHLVAVKT